MHVDAERPGTAWKRKGVSHAIDLDVSADSPAPRGLLTASKKDIQIFAAIRKVAGCKTVTLSVVNGRSNERTEGVEKRIFQVKVRVESSDGGAVFLPRPPAPHLLDSKELWNFELLYRDQPQFAVGHGCSVDWISGEVADRAAAIWTEWMPAEEVPKASFSMLSGDNCLLLECLSNEDDRAQVCADLESIPKAYEQWTVKRRAETGGLVARFPAQHAQRIRDAIDANLTNCEDACKRIREGIQLLATDDDAWVSAGVFEDVPNSSGPRCRAANCGGRGIPSRLVIACYTPRVLN